MILKLSAIPGYVALALILLCLSPYSTAFGTVFTTAQQRALLDDMRDTVEPIQAREYHGRQELKKTSLALDGMVTRRQGPNSVWINGHLQTRVGGRSVADTAGEMNSRGIAVLLPVSKRVVQIKPGQVLNLDNGELINHYDNVPQGSAIQDVGQASSDMPDRPLLAAPPKGE
ncbi:MAG: hypothetical protein KBT88_03225 [Gammaproteobacteria bacterium]|nr:hypothetical protein [Gammaproteobacteria bacterium]MBQ0838771.1 hypothetical protein [Gammaproteobacteria bacterium]